MSDLQCAARLLVARHAEASFVEKVFSDEGGSLTSRGREQAAALAASLAGDRVAAIFCSDLSRAVQTAEIVAARLGVMVHARTSLREVFVGDHLGREFDATVLEAKARQWLSGDLGARFEGGESGDDVLGRYRSQLDEVADLHRGETVLVVAHETALRLVIRALGGLDDEWFTDGWDHAQVVEVDADADGWRVSAHRAP